MLTSRQYQAPPNIGAVTHSGNLLLNAETKKGMNGGQTLISYVGQISYEGQVEAANIRWLYYVHCGKAVNTILSARLTSRARFVAANQPVS